MALYGGGHCFTVQAKNKHNMSGQGVVECGMFPPTSRRTGSFNTVSTMIRTISQPAEKFPVYVCYRIRCFTFYVLNDRDVIKNWITGYRHSAVNRCTVHRFRRKTRVETTIEQVLRVRPRGLLNEDEPDHRQPESDPYDYREPVLELLEELWSRPLITPETKKYEGKLNPLSFQIRSVRNLFLNPWRFGGYFQRAEKLQYS